MAPFTKRTPDGPDASGLAELRAELAEPPSDEKVRSNGRGASHGAAKITRIRLSCHEYTERNIRCQVLALRMAGGYAVVTERVERGWGGRVISNAHDLHPL